MRLVDYLDTLNWTQMRLAQEAHVSPATIGRVIQEKTITRRNADAICETLTKAMGRTNGLNDVNEIHVTRSVRPERRGPRKTTREEE